MQALSESKKKGTSSVMQPNLTEGQDSPTDGCFATNGGIVGSLAQSRRDPEQQIQMSSVQSLVTLQGKPNSRDSKHNNGAKGEQFSSGEVDDFSLFQQPLEGAAHQETDVNNTFHEINQSVDQVCQDDPDFQSILSNRMQAAPTKPQLQTEAEMTAAQAALLQKATNEAENYSNYSSSNYSEKAREAEQDSQASMVERRADDKFAQQTQLNSQQDQFVGNLGALLQSQAQHRPKQADQGQSTATEASKTARMNQKVSFMTASGYQQRERTAKSSTRQKRPPKGFALPTFSNEAGATPQFQISDADAGAADDVQQQQQQHTEMMQQLQPKLRINLKNLPSTSGGSSSYSNKDLSERLQGIMWQKKNQGALTSGVSPTLQRNFLAQWPNEGDSSNATNRTGTIQYQSLKDYSRSGTERDDSVLMSSGQAHGASPLHTALKQHSGSNMPPMPANLSQDPYFYLQWRQQTHKSCRSAHPNHNQANYLIAQRKAASPGTTNAHTLRLNQGMKGRRKGTGTNGQVNDSASSFSNSSTTTVPVKSLTEVKNPSNLITFRFVNRKVTHLKEISRFRNLTELDVNGNLLQQEVSELINLPFLKKLNLSGNQIHEMWQLPKTLEILNLSFNCLKKLNIQVMRSLCNLTTLEISNNGIESLEGLEHVSRLKRLIARNNQIQQLAPINSLKLVIEIDMENNPIDSALTVLKAVSAKKDILLLNLRLAPLMVKVQSYEEFIESVEVASLESTTTGEAEQPSKLVQDFGQLLTFLHNGTFYRRRRIYTRIKQQQQSLHINERRFSNFSNDEDSFNGVNQQNTQSGGAFSNLKQNLSGSGSGTNPYRRTNDKLPAKIGKNQRTNSTGMFSQGGGLHHHPYRNGSKGGGTRLDDRAAAQRSQRYEAIISLYDKLLEDEDKLLLQKKKKEAKERKLLRQKLREEGKSSENVDMDELGLSEEDDDDDEDECSIDLDDDDDDFDDELLSEEFNKQLVEDHQSYLDDPTAEDLAKGVDLDDLQTYHNQHFGVEQLNESTADFNKEIKQINQQLLSEGHLAAKDPITPTNDQAATQKKSQQNQNAIQIVEGDDNATDSPAVQTPTQDKAHEEEEKAHHESTTTLKQQSSATSDQIDTHEISVVVPMEERSSRYTNRQHHVPPNAGANNSSATKQLESSVVRSTPFEQPQQNFNLRSRQNQTERDVNSDTTSLDKQEVASMSKKSVQPVFKLDLAKIKQGQQSKITADFSSNRQDSATAGALEDLKKVAALKIAPGESMRNKPNQVQLMSVRKIQNQITLAQISERIPIKKSHKKSPGGHDNGLHDINQSGANLDTSYQSAQIVKKHRPMPLQQQKQVHIPKLALQNIHRQPSEHSHNSQAQQQNHLFISQQDSAHNQSQWKQINVQQIKKTQQGVPKNLKIMSLSKRDDSVASSDHQQQKMLNPSTQQSVSHTQHNSLTLKQSQITKTLQGKELLELYETVDYQRRIINDCKRVLGDQKMTDNSIVGRILALQNAHKNLQREHKSQVESLFNRHQMQVEDMQGQFRRLLETQHQLLGASASAAAATGVMRMVGNVNDSNFLDQLEKNDQRISQQQQRRQSSSNENGCGGGRTLRIKDIRNADKTGLTGSSTAEQLAILELLNQSTASGGAKKLAQTGRGHKISSTGAFTKSLLEIQTSNENTQQTKQVRTDQLRSNSIVQQVLSNTAKHKTTGAGVTMTGGTHKNSNKNSGRQSGRRDSGQAFELSSKREYLDLCQSPTGLATATQLEADTTLERACQQDDILDSTAPQQHCRKAPIRQQVVSDFNPAIDESTIFCDQTVETVQDMSMGKELDKEIKPQKSQHLGLGEQREDSFRRVGFFLEKIKERNSSLQERLNLSFKKSARLDQSSISYRPTTSMGNKKSNLRGTLIERESISLTRNPNGIKQQRTEMPKSDTSVPHSKTPNLVNLQSNSQTMDDGKEESKVQKQGNDSLHRMGMWDGRKPQIVRQIPANQLSTLQSSGKKDEAVNSSSTLPNPNNIQEGCKNKKLSQVVSPTNNYIDFLQTGSVNQTSQQQSTSNNHKRQQQDQINHQLFNQQPKTALSVLEETNQHLRECGSKLQSKQSTNLADQSESGPLFNFYQCTEVLHQLSTTSRGTNVHSSKNRSFILRGSSNNNVNSSMNAGVSSSEFIQQAPTHAPQQTSEYSSLLKQRSKNAIMPQGGVTAQKKSPLIDHNTAAQMIKQGTSIIQRASSLDMVPRKAQHNNYVTTAGSSRLTSHQHQQPKHSNSFQHGHHHQAQQHLGHHQHHTHHQSSRSGAAQQSSSYWTQKQQQQAQQTKTLKKADMGVDHAKGLGVGLGKKLAPGSSSVNKQKQAAHRAGRLQ